MLSIFNLAVPVLLIALIISGLSAVIHRNKKLTFVTSSAIFLILLALGIYYSISSSSFYVLSIYHVFPFSSFTLILFPLALLLVNVAAYYMEDSYIRFGIMLPILSVGILSVGLASSLLTILVSIELMTIPTILLIALNGKKYAEPATKLFLMSAISVAVLAFSIVLVFPYDSSLSLVQAVSGSTGTIYFLILSMILLVASLGTEAALFPFDLWIPDVYQGSPNSISPMLAGINKKVAFIALIEIAFIVFSDQKADLTIIFEVLAILTMFFGNLGAMVQTNVKRMLAYSSISQAGYIIVGLAAASSFGIGAALFQIFAHSFMIIGAFVIAGFFAIEGFNSISDYSGLYKRSRFLTFSLTIIMLSMAGIPGLIGFVGKFLLFSSAISSGLIALAFIGIINSFISIYYYSKLISSMYSSGEHRGIYVPRGIYFAVLVIVAIVILFGIYPAPLISLTSAAAFSLSSII